MNIERIAKAIAASEEGREEYDRNFIWEKLPDEPCIGKPTSKAEYLAMAKAAVNEILIILAE